MTTLLDSIQKLFLRDLDLLAEEIKSYPNEESLWVVEGDIKNSAGNLCLHLCGNLQHFIGTLLGSTGYVRNREAEFSDRNIPKTKLLAQIQSTRESIITTLGNMTPDKLQMEYPVQVFGEPMNTTYFLIHLATHLTYHRGQINYHRRLLTTSA